jgi:hypothetical protein
MHYECACVRHVSISCSWAWMTAYEKPGAFLSLKDCGKGVHPTSRTQNSTRYPMFTSEFLHVPSSYPTCAKLLSYMCQALNLHVPSSYPTCAKLLSYMCQALMKGCHTFHFKHVRKTHRHEPRPCPRPYRHLNPACPVTRPVAYSQRKRLRRHYP